jgi:hypothetical protein
MDLKTNNNVDRQNLMLISSENSPLDYETFNAFHESGDAVEHQFNTIDDSFATFDDKLVNVQKPVTKDSVIKIKQSSLDTPLSGHENVLSTAEEAISNLSVDNLELFSDLLFNDPIDENCPKIPTADELQEFKAQDHNITMTDQLQEELVPMTEQLQEEEHIPMDDELQLASPSSQPPSAKGSRKRRQSQNILIPHEYNTRKMAYEKSLTNFMIREQEMLEKERNNQQKPTALDAPTDHGRWSHTKDWVHIKILKLDIPIKKSPNYSQTKRYKTRKTHSKNVPDTS